MSITNELFNFKTLEYPVDIHYGEKDWTMPDAIRELISNMLDTKAQYECYWENGKGFVKDYGCGLPKSAFLFGVSTKSDDCTSIGQYGEGLKMALITTIRNGFSIEIKTMEYGAIAKSIEKNGHTLLIVEFNKNIVTKGTEIVIGCNKEDWDIAYDRFLQLKDGFSKLGNGIFLPGGAISVQGVITEKRPTLLFSYDFVDKTLTNRDRNTVKSTRFTNGMKNALENINAIRTAKAYIEGLKDEEKDYVPEEYSITLNPKHKEVWLNALKNVYGEKIVYAASAETAIKAITKGYTVIPTPTKAIRDTLKNLGVVNATSVTKGMKTTEAVLEEEGKISYPISKNYVENWTTIDAGREFLSNAIDSMISNETPSIEYKNGCCTIIDNGKGIARENFVIGNSAKKDSDIGMFGEGLKLACLVLAREDRNPIIETVGCTYIPYFEESDKFNTEIFCLKCVPNNRKKGTIVTYFATNDEVDKLKGLFLTFSKLENPPIWIDNVGVLDDGGGNIYVQGLKTASENSMFSYCLKDRMAVNSRDRKSVDNTILANCVERAISSCDNENIIRAFLTNWQKNASFYEYRLSIYPCYKDNWVVIAKDVFKNTCIGDSYDMESAFIATQAGYKVLTTMPYSIKEILNYALPSASEVAEPYRGKGISNDGKVVYPISEGYATSWNVVDAACELVSNAIDTNTTYSIKNKSNSIIIEDMGSGIPKKGLLFGTSGKSDNGKAIGMFGEGLKMAMLVLAREKRNPKFETVGFSASACLLHNNEFDTDLLTIFVEENTRTKGTIFTFDGTQKEINEIKQKFITLSNEFKKVDGEEELYLPGGYLFVNGVKVCKLNDASYTYNICGAKGKSLLGRDRKTPDMYGVKDICSNILGNTSSKDVIKTILSSTWNKFELCLGSNYWKINSRRKKTWKNVAMEVYPKSCLPVGNTETNLVAKDNGYKVLHQLPSEIISILQAIGFPTASMAAGEVKGQDEIRVIKDSELSANGKKRLEMARMIVEELYGSSIAKKLYAGENFTDPDGGITLGIYSPMLDKCLILRSVVESSPLYKLLGTAVHEACHKSTSTKDRTRDFENELTDCIGKLAEKFLS